MEQVANIDIFPFGWVPGATSPLKCTGAAYLIKFRRINAEL